MKILGVHGSFGRADHDPAAVLVVDGEVVAAAEEERFVRRKHAVGLMPEHAIRYCLTSAGLEMRDVDYVAFPRLTWFDMRDRLPAFLRFRFGSSPRLEFFDHHLAHAASAFIGSGFSEALVVSADRSGDRTALAVYRCTGSHFVELHREPFPNSLGLFAAMMTQYLGFASNNDEYKVMGLAALGEPTFDLADILSVHDGHYDLHRKWVNPYVLKPYPFVATDQLPIFSDALDDKLRLRRLPGVPLTREHADLAASVQKQIERALTSVIRKWQDDADSNLCLAGGVAQNSVLNGVLAASRLAERIYVPPAAHDGGSALGAALYLASELGDRCRPVTNSFYGPAYSDADVRRYLSESGLSFRQIDDPASTAAEILARGLTVGWFQGRAEFGPRALGSRSLLANPGRPAMRHKVNRIKGREKFRPFAPSLLEEDASNHLVTPVDSPFMSFTVASTALGRARFPAATHTDGTARVQTVSDSDTQLRPLLSAFKARTSLPAILNTSLNAGWEPIVLTPQDAVAHFHACALDALVIGSFLLEKSPQRRSAPTMRTTRAVLAHRA
jgi:carbamoyltransferase